MDEDSDPAFKNVLATEIGVSTETLLRFLDRVDAMQDLVLELLERAGLEDPDEVWMLIEEMRARRGHAGRSGRL